MWIFQNEVSHFSLCKSSLSLPFHVFPDPILTSNVFNISGTARQNFCWRSCSIFLCLVFMGKRKYKIMHFYKKKIPPLKKATITSFEIEPFPIANLKNHKCCASCIFWVYWLRTLTNNLFSIALPPEVLWRCCTTWSPGSLWSPSSPPYCEPSDLPPGSRYHLLLPCELFNLFIY